MLESADHAPGSLEHQPGPKRSKAVLTLVLCVCHLDIYFKSFKDHAQYKDGIEVSREDCWQSTLHSLSLFLFVLLSSHFILAV